MGDDRYFVQQISHHQLQERRFAHMPGGRQVERGQGIGMQTVPRRPVAGLFTHFHLVLQRRGQLPGNAAEADPGLDAMARQVGQFVPLSNQAPLGKTGQKSRLDSQSCLDQLCVWRRPK